MGDTVKEAVEMNVKLHYDAELDWEIQTMSVIGSFNGFAPGQVNMERGEGGWECEMQLPPGEHLYKFLANGELPLHDPYNNLFEEDGAGNLWSLIIIDENGQRLFNPEQYGINIDEYHLSAKEKRNDLGSYSNVTEQKITAILRCNNISGLHCITAAWYAPDGSLFEYSDNPVCTENDEDVSVMFWIERDSALQINENGAWKLRIFVDGDLIMEDFFTITSSETINDYFA